jgi:hypothetical protein
MPMKTPDLLEQVFTIAKDAGQAIMAVYARDFSIEEKDDKSPLTEADKAAHEVIVKGLEALPGGIPVLSEVDDARSLWQRVELALEADPRVLVADRRANTLDELLLEVCSLQKAAKAGLVQAEECCKITLGFVNQTRHAPVVQPANAPQCPSGRALIGLDSSEAAKLLLVSNLHVGSLASRGSQRPPCTDAPLWFSAKEAKSLRKKPKNPLSRACRLFGCIGGVAKTPVLLDGSCQDEGDVVVAAVFLCHVDQTLAQRLEIVLFVEHLLEQAVVDHIGEAIRAE